MAFKTKMIFKFDFEQGHNPAVIQYCTDSVGNLF